MDPVGVQVMLFGSNISADETTPPPVVSPPAAKTLPSDNKTSTWPLRGVFSDAVPFHVLAMGS